jgi:lipopolysaccharide export system permease protein
MVSMQLVSRYVLLDFLLVFAVSLAVSAGLMLFVGATLDLPRDVGAAEIRLMLPFLLPEAIRNALQASALFAACSVFGRLAGGNELLALSSLGISPFQVIRPVLLLAVLLSLLGVWLYDLGESWGQRRIERVVIDSAEAIVYRSLRINHTYTKGRATLNVKALQGRKLIRPTLILENEDQSEPVTISAADGELRTSRDRVLSVVMRDGTVYIGSAASMVFPDSMEQIIPLRDAGRAPRWPPMNRSLAGLQEDIADHEALVADLERASRVEGRAAPAAETLAAKARDLEHERGNVRWLHAQVNRRWTNGFFCLAYVMVGIPVAMRIRSRDYLTSFFACFLPIVLLNHPLHNFCIKLAESGRAPSVLPWGGDLVLFGLGAYLLRRSLRH